LAWLLPTELLTAEGLAVGFEVAALGAPAAPGIAVAATTGLPGVVPKGVVVEGVVGVDGASGFDDGSVDDTDGKDDAALVTFPAAL
jgi:hypothetical protein